jgi:hypothetical protein
MSHMAGLIICLWAAGIAAKAFAAFRLWRIGLAERFPTLFALLIVLAVQSGVALGISGDKAHYAQAYALIAWVSVLMEGFAVTGVFWVVAEFYPRFRIPGTILLAGLAIIGTAICWVAGYIAEPPGWYSSWRIAILGQRAISAVMLFVLVGTRLLLPRVQGIPIRPSARRAADILTLHVGLTLLGAIISVATLLSDPGLISIIAVTNGLALGLFCAVALTPESDLCPQSAPRRVNLAEVRAAQQRNLDGLRDYVRMLERQR